MTFLPTLKTGKLSCFVLNCVQQTVSTTSYTNVQIESSVTSTVNQFNTTLTASSSTDRITLPEGKYYLDARLYVYVASTSTWAAEHVFYEYSNSTKTEIGFVGKECGAVAIGDPQKSEHSIAYIESDGTKEIGLQVKKVGSLNVIISSTTLANGAGQSRIMIWRIE